ncbi:MAG: excinuclease subunit [Myxococcales bacterium]|nr:excinuclease subunit [Myxococcales bacterium]
MGRAQKHTGEQLELLGGTDAEVSDRLKEILGRVPTDPGVYLMKDKKGRIIYVGKAANLKARVRSYFNQTDTRDFVPLLGRILADIETVVVGNEKEALLLENNLIKQHQPKFNVKLADDKNFLVLRLDPTAHYPRLEVTRHLGKDGAKYFGPYHSATSCRATLAVVNRHFKLRTCTDQVLSSRKRPCLQYQIKRCDAPCVFPIGDEEYGKQVQDVALFLDGKDDELLKRLSSRMKAAATGESYEIAASVRDQIKALEHTLEEQRIVSSDFRDQDVFGLYREGEFVEIVVLSIRNGKLMGRRNFSLKGQEFPTHEILSSFVSLYYDMGTFIPDEVLLPEAVEDMAAKSEWLTEKRATRRGVEVMMPQRGSRHDLMVLAQKNASSSFVTRRDKSRDAEAAMEKLQQRLSLKRLPKRIECFDISHIQGTATVASMVVFLDGEPAKSEYRTFKVKTATNDDFASMYEVLSRRFRRSKAAAEHKEGEVKKGWVVPDLLVIDGGKGQLSTAVAALRDAQIDIGMNGMDVVALAKEREDESGDKQPDRVFRMNVKDPMKLRANSAELFLLSRIRDEAHRFAVTFHKKLRRRRTLRSALEDVPGVGQKRKRELLKHFGSLKKVRVASVEELQRAPGMSRTAAEAVVRYFHGDSSGVSSPLTADSQQAEAGSEAISDQVDVAEDAAAAELEVIASEEEATGQIAPDEEE